MNNFQSQIGLAKLKQGQCRCPECGAETFVILEIKDYTNKIGKYQDYDYSNEEKRNAIFKRTLSRMCHFHMEMGKNQMSYVETKSAGIVSNINNSKIIQNYKVIPINKKNRGCEDRYYKCSVILNCTKCYWFKFAYQKPFGVPL